jgi:chromosome segregation ATPase
MINSLAFCAQAVLTEAKIMSGAARPRREAAAPFSVDELRGHLESTAAALSPGYEEIAGSLRTLAGEAEQHYPELEALEQRLTVLEEKMMAIARASQTEAALLEARQELDRQLRPFRSKMSAEQLTMLERQYLDRNLLEKSGLPRLSLFYMR